MKTAAPHMGFPSGSVTFTPGSECFYSSSVLVDRFVLRHPPERKARNRWLACIYNQHKMEDCNLEL